MAIRPTADPSSRGRHRGLLQRLKELVAADTRVGEDAAEGAALYIPGVDENGDHIGAVEVREVVMTSLERASLQPFRSRTRISWRERTADSRALTPRR